MRTKLFGMLLVFSLLATMAVPVLAAPVTGAIFTTDMSCTGVNLNIFDSKSDVYLDGGPQNPNAGSGLPDGFYYVQVTTPNGDVLGFSNTAVVEVSGGEFVDCYQLMDILYTASSGFMTQGYDDTDNPGGVYKVWASLNPAFPPSESRTDNFKVNAGEPVVPATLNVVKFYDANANGINDDGLLIDGWKVRIQNGLDLIRYTPASVQVDPGDYMVTEFYPVEPNWMSTTVNPVYITLAAGDDATVEFGNLCLGPGGGKTLGFWSNRNGQAMIGADDLAMLSALNLRDAAGSDFDPATYGAFRTWLLNATATNMSYMLSAQLAAMELNVFNGLVDGDALIHAPGSMSANALGFATVNAIMAEANAELGLHGTAFAGDDWRSYQEALKNALDNANNNYTFVQPFPCDFSFAE